MGTRGEVEPEDHSRWFFQPQIQIAATRSDAEKEAQRVPQVRAARKGESGERFDGEFSMRQARSITILAAGWLVAYAPGITRLDPAEFLAWRTETCAGNP